MNKRLIPALAAAFALSLPFSTLAAEAYVSPTKPAAAAEASAEAEAMADAGAVALPAKPELIRQAGSPIIYVKLDTDVVAPVSDPATLRKVAPKPTPIKVVPNVQAVYKIDSRIDASRVTTERKLLPAANPINVEHNVVKEPTKPTVYVIDECGRKRPILDEATFRKLRFSFANVKTISPAALQKYASGATVSQEALNIKYQGSNTTLQLAGDRVSAAGTTAATPSKCDVFELPKPPVSVPLPVEPTPYPGNTQAFYPDSSYYVDTSVYQPQDSGYGYPWLVGATQGFVSIAPGKAANYLPLKGTHWSIGDTIPTGPKEVLSLCQKFYPGTYAAINLNNQNYMSAYYRYLGMPTNGGWLTYACTTPPPAGSLGPLPAASDLGAVAYWYGKVNKYSQANPTAGSAAESVRWISDPDGTSGGNLDTLNYCKKWFPQTRSVSFAGLSMLSDWKNRGLTDSYRGTGNVFTCSSAEAAIPQMPGTIPVEPTPTPTPTPTPIPGLQPVISNLHIEVVTETSFVLSWNTNIGTDAYVHANSDLAALPQTQWGRVHEYDPTATSHRHVYFGLTRGTTYYYEVRNSVPGGGTAILSGSVTTNGVDHGSRVDLEPAGVHWVTGETNGLQVVLANTGTQTFNGSFIVSLYDLDSSQFVDYYTFTGTIAAGNSYNAIVNTLYGSPSHYPNLQVTVDYANTVDETNEGNNSVYYHYSAPTVDLQPTAASWVSGQGLRLEVANRGTVDYEGHFIVSLYDLDGGSFVDYYTFNAAIAAGHAGSAIVSTLAGSTGHYPNLRLMADYANTVPETNEENNTINYSAAAR